MMPQREEPGDQNQGVILPMAPFIGQEMIRDAVASGYWRSVTVAKGERNRGKRSKEEKSTVGGSGVQIIGVLNARLTSLIVPLIRRPGR